MLLCGPWVFDEGPCSGCLGLGILALRGSLGQRHGLELQVQPLRKIHLSKREGPSSPLIKILNGLSRCFALMNHKEIVDQAYPAVKHCQPSVSVTITMLSLQSQTTNMFIIVFLTECYQPSRTIHIINIQSLSITSHS